MCVLPAGATDLYTAIKQYVYVFPTGGHILIAVHCTYSFGDVQVGIATQCMQSLPCKKANKQYVANVLLKQVCSSLLGQCNLDKIIFQGQRQAWRYQHRS